jgi:hypothetical protein
MNSLIKIIPIIFLCFNSFAQQTSSLDFLLPKSGSHEQCITELKHQRLLQEYGIYKERFETDLQSSIQKNSQQGGEETYYIPVVVHIMHLGESENEGTNISDEQILSAIEQLNKIYGMENTGPDTKIAFCLATQDPNGQSTDGIIRVNASSVTDYAEKGVTDLTFGDGTSDNESELKAVSYWNNLDYYNIWVVNEINDNDGGSGTQGYAYYPNGGFEADYDGTIILYNAFGYDPDGTLGYNLKNYTNLNATLAHELGHALDLRHTFEGDDGGLACPSNIDCENDGDLVCDTDPHSRDEGNCEDSGETCFGVGTDLADIVTNIMAYSSDICQTKFSQGQKNRMRQTLVAGGSRSSLANNSNAVCLTAESWDCNNGDCSDPIDGSGEFSSLTECNSNCVEESWDCDNGNCFDPMNGSGEFSSLTQCNNNCVAESWDCNNGDCFDPMDGSGEFLSLSQCNNNCEATSLNESTSSKINIYPNPSEGIFTINIQESQDVGIKIISQLGKTIQSKTVSKNKSIKEIIDLSAQPKGIYFLNLYYGNSMESFKLIRK